MSEHKAYFVRQKTSRDWSEIAIRENKIFIGWSKSKELLSVKEDYYKMREIVKSVYYSGDSNYNRVKNAMGTIWKFISEMDEGSLIAIPCSGGVYIGIVKSECKHNEEWIDEDRAFYRDVKWCVDKPVPRNYFDNDIQMKMKNQSTLVKLPDCYGRILGIVEMHKKDEIPTLKADVKENFNKMLLNQLYNGKIDNYGFEKLVEKLLREKEYETNIVARNKDTGTDIECKLNLFSGIEINVFVQVKQWHPDTTVGVDVFKKLLTSMEEKNADYGVVVTTAKIDESSVIEYISEVNKDGKYQLAYIDGDMLCEELVNTGVFPDFNL